MIEWIATEDTENHQRGWLQGPLFTAPCAAGKKGFIDGSLGREGDQATPTGTYPLRQVFYRPDRLNAPITGLPVMPLSPDMGWCDDPADKAYNRLIRLPYPASHELLWREDTVYDVILVIGHNDDPVEPNKGSAVFLHLARADFSPTMGCLAFAQADMMSMLSKMSVGDRLTIKAA